MHFNYQEICNDITEQLPDRARNVIVRRFGLNGEQKATLQVIGKDLGITRERVRQIQGFGFSKMAQTIKAYGPAIDFFNNQLKSTGNLRREDVLLKILSPGQSQNHVFFLLCLSDQFNRFLENKDFYTVWATHKKPLDLAQKIIEKTCFKLKKTGKPLRIGDLDSNLKIGLPNLLAYLEISKAIQKGPQGLWGLKAWPEISPKGVRDKSYIIFTQEQKPLHFTKVAQLINEKGLFNSNKKAHSQTVHNELIKDKRFVLVGRGLYALAEWGYKPGVVKDVIINVLEQAKKPLTKNEIMDAVLKQRFVAKNTILLNLHNKKYFERTPEGEYILASSKS